VKIKLGVDLDVAIKGWGSRESGICRFPNPLKLSLD